MRVLYNNEVFNSTIDATSESPFYPFDTAFNDIRLSRVGRTVNDTAQGIVFSFSSTVDVSYICILNHNITNGATITLEGNSSDSWGAPAFTTSLVHGDVIIKNFTKETYQYWRLYVDDGSNPDGYIEISYVFLGEYLDMPGVEQSQVFPRRTTTTSQKNVSGQLYANKGVQLKAATIVFPGIITDTQRGLMNAWYEYVDLDQPFVTLFWEDDLTVEPPLYSNLITPLEWTRVPEQGFIFTLTIELEECK